MTDDNDDIKRLLAQTPAPKPSDEKKKAALSKALEAFDAQSAKHSQGTAKAGRPIHTAWAAFMDFMRESVMTKTRLVAGTAMAAVLVLATSTFYYAPRMQSDVHVLTKAQGSLNTSPSPYRVEETASDALVLSPPPPPQIDARAKNAGAAGAAQQELKSENFALAKPVSPSVMQDGSALRSAAPAEALAMVGQVAPGVAMSDQSYAYYQDQGRDKFESIKTNPIKVAAEEPLSTFSVDVDTASYSFVRASLNQNVLPQKDAVRVEELINYFPYQYEAPATKEEPFKANLSLFPTPWNKETKLLHIGIKGYEMPKSGQPHSNLVFLIDTSGSMNAPNKLPLLQNSLKMLLDTLKSDDTIAIVTYAGSAGIALEPTKVSDKLKIMQVIDGLGAGGSTAGAEGIRMAYQLAEKNFDKGAVNRVILATDGDFNVGITNQNELKSFIERERDSGIFLSVLGFGMGNYNDAMMQALAQNGNGNAAYIDTIQEARKALVEEAGSTLFTIAKDVKIQVEFNPSQVKEYRLIGYENRLLNREDFNNDKVDAGDIGAGHTVTAIYEIVPVNSKAALVDDLRYGATAKPASKSDEYAFVKIRYKLPEGKESKLITVPVTEKVEFKSLKDAPHEAQFASSVAAFGQILRGDAYSKDFTYDDVIALAEANKGSDSFGYRSEFINLVRLAKNAPQLPVQK